MPNNDSLIIIIFGLIAIIIIVGAYGVIGYKIYLRNNARQLNEMTERVNKVNEDYKKLIEQSLTALLCFTTEMQDFKKHPIYKRFKDDTRDSSNS